MFKFSLLLLLCSFGIASFYSQNSSFSAIESSQCPGSLFTLSADDNSLSSYTWTITNEISGDFETYNVNPVAFVLDEAGLYTVKLEVSDAGGSSETTLPGFLEVFANPIIDYSVSLGPYCAPAIVDFTSNCLPGSGSIISYQAFTDGTSYITDDFQHTYASPGSFPVNISIENSNGCVASENLPNIVVSEFPALTSPLNPNTTCSGTAFSYIPISSIPGSTFSWVRLDNPNILEPPSNGIGNISEILTTATAANETVIYEVTTISPGGCQNIQNVELTIQALPVVTVDDAVLCTGQTSTLTATPSQPGGTYTWIPSGATQTISVNVPGTYTVTYAIGSCTSASVDATVTEIASPSLTGISLSENSGLAPNDGDICKGDDIVTLTATASTTTGTFTWTPGGPGNSIDVSPNSTTVYVVEYEDNGCLSDPLSQTITVFSAPSNTYTASITNSCSSPITTVFESTSSGLITWSFPGGTPNTGAGSGPISVDYNSSGIYDIQMTNISAQGCETVTDFPAAVVIGNGFPPFSSFSLEPSGTPPVQCLEGNNFCFVFDGFGADTVEWDFGDGSPVELHDEGDIVCHTFTSIGSFNVTMVPYTTVGSALGCSGIPETMSVEILGPISSFTVSPLDCENQLTRTFTSTSSGTSAATQYSWDFNDSASDTVFTSGLTFVPDVLNINVGDVVVFVNNGGNHNVNGTQATFPANPVSFGNSVGSGWTYDFQFNVPGTYLYQCDPHAGMNMDGTIIVSPNPTSTSTTYTFSDYSPSYTVPYLVTLTVEDPATGCPASTSTQNILAFPNDQASFAAYTDVTQTTQTSEVCLGDELVFFNTTPLPQNTNPSTNSQDTQWDWSTAVNGINWFTSSEYRGSPEDLLFSEEALPTSGNIPWQPGVYTVAMRNRANNYETYCYDTVYNDITVHGIIGGFTVPDTVCVGQVFNVIDNSSAPLTSIVSREWDWESDGTVDLSGNVQNTTHSFSTPGVYTISMTAEDAFGCPKTATQTIVVREVLASFSVDRTFICGDEQITITNNNSISFGTPTYDWTASSSGLPATPGNSSSFIPEDSFLFTAEGPGSISLTITDNLGCTDDTTVQINVFNVFAAATASPNSSSCFNPPTVVNFTDLSGNNVDPSSYQWYFGNGETSSEANPSTIYSLPGQFEVSLVVSSLTGGCSDSTLVETIDIGGPFGSISVSNTELEGCSCYEAQIDVTTSEVEDATLLFGDGSFQNLTINTSETIIHQYCNEGTTSQNLTPILFISSGTCNGNIPAAQTITVHPIPDVVNPGDFEYCEGEVTNPISFSGSVPSTIFDWINDNPSIGLASSGSGNISSFNATTPGGDNIALISVTPSVVETGCTGDPESFSITIKNTTIANASGPENVICAGSNISVVGSFEGGATSASWSVGGDASGFDNPNDLVTNYTPTLTDITNGSVTLTLTTDDPDGPCPANSSDFTVTIDPGALADAGPDATVCSNDLFVTQGQITGSTTEGEWSTTGSGIFDPADVTGAIYTPSPTDLANGFVTLILTSSEPDGPCGISTSSMELSFSVAATLSVVSPIESCIGTDVPLSANPGGSASVVNWTVGPSGGIFSNLTNSTSDYTPSETDNTANIAIVTAGVDDPDGVGGPCPGLSEDIQITLFDTVDVDAGPDVVLCSNDSLTLNGAISVGGVALTGTWSSNGTGLFNDASIVSGAIYTPSAEDILNGFVILTLTSDNPGAPSPCFASSDEMELSFTLAATIEIPAEGTGTCDNSAVPVTAIPNDQVSSVEWDLINGGQGSYLPDAQSLSIDYSATAEEIANGSALLIVTTNDPDGAGPCTAASDSVTINIATDVTVDAGIDTTACAGEVINLDGSFGGAAGSATWTVGGLSTGFLNPNDPLTIYTPTVTDLANGFVTLTLTTDDPVGPCVPASDQVTYTFVEPAIVSAGSDTVVCSNSAIQLDGDFDGTASVVTWTVLSTGNDSGFNNVNSPTPVYTPTAEDLTLGTIILTITTNDPDGPGGCPAVSSSMELTVNEAATINVISPIESCINNEIALTSEIDGAATSVTWSNFTGTISDTFSLTPTYLPSATENGPGGVAFVAIDVETNDPDGTGPCPAAIETVILQIDPEVIVSAGPNDAVCSNTSIDLNGSIDYSTLDDPVLATWISSGSPGTLSNPNNMNATYTPSAADIDAGMVTFTLTTDDPPGQCPAVSSSMEMIVSEAATLSVLSPIVACINNEIALSSEIGGGAESVTWSNFTGTISDVNSETPTYLPSEAENNSSPFTIEVSTEDPDGEDGPCLALTEQVEISINELPIVFAGNEIKVCSNNLVQLDGSFDGAATSVIWTSSGNGSFDNATLVNAVYTPDSDDLSNGTVTLTLTTNDPDGPCEPASSEVLVTFVPVPISSAGLNQDICSDEVVSLNGVIENALVGTWTSNTIGTPGEFTPNELDLNAQYIPSADDIAAGSVVLTLTTDDTSGVCGVVSSDMTINLFNFATVNAGIDQSICSAEDVLLGATLGGSAALDGTITWTTGTSGDGEFFPNNALNATYVTGPNDQNSGFVWLIATTFDPDGPCEAAIDSLGVFISGVAEVEAGSNFTVCAGEDVPLNGDISGAVITGEWSGGAGTFSDFSDLNSFYTPTPAELASGSVTLTLTSADPFGPCGPEFDTVVVSFTSSAIASAGPDQVVCEGDDILLDGAAAGSASIGGGTWSSDISGGIFVPNATDEDAVYIPSPDEISAGVASLVFTTIDPAGPCPAASDTVLITINPSPVLSSSSDFDICSGTAVNYPITSDVSSTFVWNAQTDEALLNGESLLPQATSAIDDILDNTSTSIQTVTYLVSATAIGSGCTNDNQIVNVNVNPVVTMDIPPSEVLCVGESTTNVIFSSSFAGITYNWTNNNTVIGLGSSGDSDILSFIAENTTAIIQTGMITVTPAINGCAGIPVSFEITVNPSSTVDDPGAIAECDGAPTENIIFTGSDPSIIYNWTNTNPAIGIPVSGSGDILSFIATNLTNDPIQATIEVTPELNGCDGASQTFTINVDPSPEMDIPADQTICVTNNSVPVVFTSNVIGTSYDWTNDNINIGLDPSGTGDILSFTTINNGNVLDTANVTVLPSFNGCGGAPIEFDFIVTPVLEVDFIEDTILCAGEEFAGVNFTGNVPDLSFEWTNNNISIGLPSNGTGNISNFIVTNSGTVDQSATVTITPILSGCTSIDSEFIITVKPVPTVSVVPLSQTLCHNEATIPVDFSGNIAAATYDWSHDDISIGLGSPGFDDIPPFTAINTSLVSETSTFTVTPSFNGCTGSSENFTITVNPTPSVFPIPSQVLCAGFPTTSINFDGDFGGAANYSWTNDNVLIGLPANGIGDISSFIVENTTSEVQIATITVTPTINGCEGLPQVFSITVKPIPTLVGPIPSQSLCVNTDSDPVVFTGNLPDVTNYNWINDNIAIGLPAAGVGDIPVFTAQNTGDIVIVSTITVTPELNGCIGLPQVFTITTVDPVPVVFDPIDQEVCSGLPTSTVNFVGPNPTTSFIWTNDNASIGLASNGTGDITSFITDNTTFVNQVATITVEPEFNGCIGESQEFTITVKPTPVVVITPLEQEICSGETTEEIDFSADLVGTTYDWINDNISINLPANGIGDISAFITENVSATVQVATINVTPTYNGCTGLTEVASITVNPISTVIVAPGVDEYCHGETTTEYIFNGSNPLTQYNWTNDNTSIGLPASGSGNILPFPVSNTDLVNQLATITVQPELNGCDGTAQIVQIIVKPIPTVDQVPDQNICANDDSEAIIFDGNLPDSTDYNWTHDNVSIGLGSNGIGNIPSFTGTNISQDVEVGNITVTPILNGCIGTAMTTSITVNPISIVNTVNDTVCSGETLPQIDFVGSNASAIYSWTNDNSSVGLTNGGIGFIPSFVSENLGTTNQTATIVVTPTVNGCDGINDTMAIVVHPLPVIDPIEDDIYCSEDLSDLIVFSGNMPINEYNWSNDNAAIGLVGSGVGDISPFITANTGTGDLVGTIIVTPNANECIGASESFTITVHPLPDVDAGTDTTLCFEQSIILTATGANTYAWDNGVINGVEFFPSETIMYTVVGTDTNLCQNTDSVLVTYTLDLPPIVDAGPDTSICIGQQIALTATGDAILYIWDNGVIDGEFFEPSVTSDYIVIATADNGCVASDTIEVAVNPLPVITAFASDDFLCAGETTILWGEGADTYVWDLSVIDSVAFVPEETATYTVVGFDINECTDTTEIEVIVNPLPDVLFSTDMLFGGCLPFEPTFTDLTSEPASNSVQWYFGNGASSTQMGSVLNTYDSYGCYDVTLVSTTAEGCTDSLTQQNFVCVNEIIAEFQPNVYEQSIVNPIFEFTNSSVNATSFEWFFGDGDESDFVNATHFYESYGNYVVSLVASAQDGCTDTAYAAITVVDEVIFYVPNSFTPNDDGKNDVFMPELTAGYDRERGYEFRIYNRWGEEVFYTDTPGVAWDGKYLNTAVQNGTYIWYVRFKDSMNNEVYDYSGHVNVIK
tara:strand:- start:254 stop:13717 length:13464 start_codon:yes stop_codon:yes gene_type:complete